MSRRAVAAAWMVSTMASAWRSSMPAACNRLTAACVSSTRLFYELQLCRRDELAWYKSAV